MSGVISWILTPSQPRCVLPNFFNCSIIGFAKFAGIEKPIPTLPPVGENIAVFIPSTPPSRLKSGPPELPLLIEASV